MPFNALTAEGVTHEQRDGSLVRDLVEETLYNLRS